MHAITDKLKRRLEDQVDEARSSIAPHTEFKGGIKGEEGVEVAGGMKGDIQSRRLVWIAAGGRMKGDVRSPYVIVEGELDGNIIAAQQVELRRPAKMKGNIETRRIAIAEGCTFHGNVSMAGEDEKPTSFVEKREADPNRP
jgi:cytoskeletal protein CcmA (bactofilin family)